MGKKKVGHAGLDIPLLLVIVFLLFLGLIQVYSSSFFYAQERWGDSLLFFRKQVFFVSLSLVTLGVLYFTPVHWIKRLSLPIFIGALGFLILTFIPGIGVKVGGGQRWISLPMGFRFQPVELFKVGSVFFMAYLLSKMKVKYFNHRELIFLYTVMLASLASLIFQPDFGNFALLAVTLGAILFCMGLHPLIVSGLVATSSLSFYFLVMEVPYRKARVLGFLNPWEDPESKGFQVIQSLMAFGNGGLIGKGLGESQAKLSFLPEAHTDFTFAVFGEEFGFLGVTALLFVYVWIVVKGFRTAMKVEETFYKSLVLGLTFLFGFSVIINLFVVLGLVPTKGMPLPFLSYGGSSLVITTLALGLIAKVAILEGSSSRKKRATKRS